MKYFTNNWSAYAIKVVIPVLRIITWHLNSLYLFSHQRCRYWRILGISTADVGGNFSSLVMKQGILEGHLLPNNKLVSFAKWWTIHLSRALLSQFM